MTLALADLAPLVDAALPAGAGDVTIVDVTHDSRQVAPGMLFVAVTGADHDGHDHAPDAVGRGAAAVLAERPLDVSVPVLVVEDSRRAMGPVAAAVHGNPSANLCLLGVTGTNGKTTTVWLVGQILDHLGRANLVIGTLSGARTTPEATDLQRQLARAAEAGVEVVAMEVSSHALALHRVRGCRFRAAAFTNLGRDHLDFHGTPERYFEAKAALFEPDLTELAVVNADDVHGRLLRDASRIPTIAVDPAAIGPLGLGPSGTRFTWRGHPVETPLIGRFNVINALLAAELVVAAGAEPGDVARALAAVTAPPGRLEVVAAASGSPLVVVDYAHTPDALEVVLEALRGSVAGGGRLILVVGCGGDRDHGKRSEMGDVAARCSDLVWSTSDNPRSEDPAAIIEDMRAGVRAEDLDRVSVEVDRRRAIGEALAAARSDDVVLIAGKGHETTQTIGAEVLEFDDRVVARQLLGSRPQNSGDRR